MFALNRQQSTNSSVFTCAYLFFNKNMLALARDAMVKSMMLSIANPSRIFCWMAFGGLAFNLGNWSAIAADTSVEPIIRHAIILNASCGSKTLSCPYPANIKRNGIAQRLAQVTPETSINRPTLKLGSEGAAVSELQAALKLLGYYVGAVDGFYGESTASAVAQFQQVAGLEPDGITGSATWNRLFPYQAIATETPAPTSSNNPASVFPVPSSLQAPPNASNYPATTVVNSPVAANPQSPDIALPVLRVGMEGPAVMRLQERLKALGLLTGTVDGVFGSETQAAVIAVQQRFNLEPDGIVGSATWSALLR